MSQPIRGRDPGPISPAEQAALTVAAQCAASAAPAAVLAPNPRVGCVLLDADGHQIALGAHRGPGTPHAEVAALAAAATAGRSVRGGTAIVTLEPCAHTGRTGPCTQALITAGVRRVLVAQRDPNPVAAGGIAVLEAAGIEVVDLTDTADGAPAHALNREWLTAVERQRPWVVWKSATTLDGRSAAADGTSQWITSLAARRDVHRLRAQADTILVGTGTLAADDPSLTVRDADDHPVTDQPLRVVMGERAVPAHARVHPVLHLDTRDPREALDRLWAAERRHVFLEGGPTLAAAFLRAGLIDQIVVYVAPVLLGSGAPMVGDLGIGTLAEAIRPTVTDVTVLNAPSTPSTPHPHPPTVRFTLEPQEVTP